MTPSRLLGFTLAALLLAPAVAAADTSSTLTVVGTSDVSDSGLMPNLIQPLFQNAYPQYTFKYVGTATGTAISNAESGAGGPSVLIVHAASLENQFVGSGFSYERYGRSIFTNDFVLAGPNGQDPAGVTANAAHNIVQAFADLAIAGGQGKIAFVSRAGSPGTVVAEHEIWARVAAMPSPPPNLLLCAVSSTNGGGETPIAPGNGVNTTGDPCPGGLPAANLLPSWYKQTGLTQGPNVVNASVCNYPPLGAGSCYVFTDRGTFAFLASGTAAAGTIPNLSIVTRDNAADAPGGAGELINYFHAYAINPAAFTSQPNVQINVPAAVAFLNFLTSPTLQSQLKNYLGGAGDPPFVAAASPLITASGIPSSVNAGTTVSVTGNVANSEPFLPPLANVPVTVNELIGGLPVPVGSGTTNGSGNYTIGFVPTSNGSYQVSTGVITQIENASPSPVFGDLLSPAASGAVPLSVRGAVIISSANPTVGGAVVSGAVGPAAPHADASVTVLARPQGTSSAFTQVGGASLGANQAGYAVAASLPPGKWQVETVFADPGQILTATSAPANVTVASAATIARTSALVSVKKKTVKLGKLTLTGTVSPGPTGSGASVQLFGLRTTSLRKATKARTAAAAFPRISKLSLGKGRTTFAFHVTLRRGHRWVLQVEYTRPGQKASFSKLSSVDVK